MMVEKRFWPVLFAFVIMFSIGITACGGQATPEVNRPAQRTTDEAATSIALTNAPPTAGPSPTPTATSTPYMTPTPLPGTEPEMVVAEVGDREITLEQFQSRVRYERWLPLLGLRRNLEKYGTERLLDLTLPENAQLLALLYTLGNTESMGIQTMNTILTEQVVLQEARRRDLELDQTRFDARVAVRIGVELGPEGARPVNWDEAYDEGMEEIEIYTGMDEDQFREIIMAQVYYDQLGEIIRDQAPLPDPSEQQGIIAVNVQDILMPSRQDALDVIDRVAGGESLLEVARSYDMAPSDGQTRRAVSRDQEGYPPAVIDAIFAAEEGDIIGPIPTDNGWYVARVLDQQLDILQPGDITQIRNEYYRQWIIERLDDPDYTVEYDNWQDYVPTDPLPQDVSPLMRDENFTLPDDQFAETGPTPTSQPLGISPR